MLKLLKYLYSFFNEEIIENAQSAINPCIEITYVNGKLVLNTKNSNYSYGSLHRVFQSVFKKINIQDREIKDVLILGFGAGSVASILINECGIKCRISAVELDQKIIDLAEVHFKISEYKELKIFQEDAADFLLKNNNKYDLVVVDVYIDNDVPAHCETSDFVKGLGRALNKDGLVVFNKLVYNKEVEELAKGLHSKFLNILGETGVYKIKDNWMLVHIKH